MQFVPNGMDIPDELIRAHEEGRVVFFCGAGISYESHLPNFRRLTEEVFARVGEVRTEGEEKQFVRERYDAVLGSLENRIAMRSQVRRKVLEILSPDPGRADNSIATHAAIVTLATVNAETPTLQLVTTNFDLLFESLLPKSGSCAKRYIAPFLPTPRKGLWNGIVYLHGRFPEQADDTELANLVLTSGDYGRAYLSEAWAARFVAELLRNYVVCFVGYSLGDQTVRYLMDAVEVYNRIGNKTEPVYVFSSKAETDVISENNSIVRVLYDENACGGNHAMLHKTLQAWANSYKQGLTGRCELIRQYAGVDPAVVPDTGYIKRMMWALSGNDNKAIKYFVTMSEAPNWGWVYKLEEEGLFVDNLLSPFDDSRRGSLFAFWVLRYMQTSRCVLWAIKNRSKVCKRFLRIAEAVCNGQRIGVDGNWIRLDGFTERLWRLILMDKVDDGRDIYSENLFAITHWLCNAKIDFLKKCKIRELMSPKVKVTKSVSFFADGATGRTEKRLQDDLSIELTLPWRHVAYHEDEMRKKLKGRLWELTECVADSFEEGLELLNYLRGGVTTEDDLSWMIPSIEDSSQNDPDLHVLVSCVTFIREGWLELLEKDRNAAVVMARKWLRSGHLAIKRLGLFAACSSDVILPEEWVRLFTEHDGYLLWRPAVKHEMLRLFSQKGNLLSPQDIALLTTMIVKGPPACVRLFLRNKDTEAENYIDHAKFVRLEKLRSSGIRLPQEGCDELGRIKRKHDHFSIAANGSDEFVVWSECTDVDDEGCSDKSLRLPDDALGLVKWMKVDLGQSMFEGDKYRQVFANVCATRHKEVIEAFRLAIAEEIVNTRRLKQALQLWVNAEMVNDVATMLTDIMPKLSEAVYNELVGSIGQWCMNVAKTRGLAKDRILDVARLVIGADYKDECEYVECGEASDFVMAAINHPTGQVVTALVDECFPPTIHRGDGIAEPYKTIFSEICHSNKSSALYGRVVLASRSIAFYYADEAWTRSNLLSFACWEKDAKEAVGFWQGFLWQRLMDVSILQSLRVEFKGTLEHWPMLKGFRQNCMSIFISLALRHETVYDTAELSAMMHKMNNEQLEYAAQCIQTYMQSATKSEKDPNIMWRDNVWPVLHDIWPKDAKLLTDRIVESLCIAFMCADEEFGKMHDDIWFVAPVDEFSYGYSIIAKGKAIRTCPLQVLDLLYRVVTKPSWNYYGLEECLAKIKENSVDVEKDGRYQKLVSLVAEAKERFEG